MTLTITDFLNGELRQDVRTVIDLTDKRLMIEEGRYSSMFPRISVPEELIVEAKFTGNAPQMVQVLAEGQEPVATKKRGTMQTVKLTDFRMGFKHLWTVTDLKMMRRANETASPAVRQGIQTHFLTTLAEKVRDLYFTGDRLCNILSLSGVVDYLDPISRLQVRMDYRPDMNLSVQTPTPLVGGAQWQNPATATPLSNIRTWSNNHYENSGLWERFRQFSTSYNIWERMKETTEVKLQVQKLRGYYSDVLSSYDTDIVTDAELRTLVLKYGQIPDSPNAVMVDDKRIGAEQADGTIVEAPFFSDAVGNSNYVRMTTNPVIAEQTYIPVPENDFRPGIYTKVHKEEGQMAFNQWFGGLANMIPVIPDPRILFAIKVGP